MISAAVTVTRGRLAHTVLRRLARAVGASVDLPIDRLEDATLVCDALLGQLDDADRASVEFLARESGLEMVFAHFPRGAGTAATTAEIPGLGAMIARLADEVWVEPDRGLDREHVHVLVGRSSAG